MTSEPSSSRFQFLFMPCHGWILTCIEQSKMPLRMGVPGFLEC